MKFKYKLLHTIAMLISEPDSLTSLTIPDVLGYITLISIR